MHCATYTNGDKRKIVLYIFVAVWIGPRPIADENEAPEAHRTHSSCVVGENWKFIGSQCDKLIG